MNSKLKVTTVVGARPQFIKAGVVNRIIRDHFSDQIEEDIIHTGQHYDHGMSDLFFEQLDIPTPAAHLGIGSSGHGNQTGEMLIKLEQEFQNRKPDAVMVYGDTNSTLAGALAAVKIHIPIIHVESGLRSYLTTMPEEVNRVCTDHISSLMSCPNQTAITNLKKEGITDHSGTCTADNPWVKFHGDVMYDNILFLREKFGNHCNLMDQFGLEENGFVLATIHRPSNTDSSETLQKLFSGLQHLADQNNLKVFLPLHPRTLKLAESSLDPAFWNAFKNDKNIIIHDPIGIIEIGQLVGKSRMVITDSGGLQKEAVFLNRPCIILRDRTEWVELVDCGWGKTVGFDPEKLANAYKELSQLSGSAPPLYGDGNAAQNLCSDILNAFS